MAWPLLNWATEPRATPKPNPHLHLARECGEWRKDTHIFSSTRVLDEEWVQSQSPSQPQCCGRRRKLTCNMKMHFSLLIENFLRELSFIFFCCRCCLWLCYRSAWFVANLRFFRGLFLVSEADTHTERDAQWHMAYNMHVVARTSGEKSKWNASADCQFVSLPVCQIVIDLAMNTSAAIFGYTLCQLMDNCESINYKLAENALTFHSNCPVPSLSLSLCCC